MLNRSPFDNYVTRVRNAELEDVIRGMMELSLIKRYSTCQHCHQTMKLSKKNNLPEQCAWRCTNLECYKYHSYISIRKYSFFDGFKYSLADIFTVIYCWSVNKSATSVSSDFNIDLKVVLKIYTKIRQKVANYIDNTLLHLGGPGTVCQIDESLFIHKVKAHRGRAPQQQI